MFRFKKEYAGQSIALPSGILINAGNINGDEAQKALKSLPSFGYMLEEVADELKASTVEEEKAEEEVEPKKTRTRKA